ncbi:MAG: hypothetical protein J6V72_07265 [Kiritimatiellae bacterium]|nr:hypothetical protein [Kiritimatiellia bacterium]
MATGKALDGMPYAGNPHVRLGAWGFARVGNTLKFGYMHGTTVLLR